MAVKTSWAAGDVLTAADLTDTFAAKAPLALSINAQTGTSYTLAVADSGKVVTMTNAAASTVTIPTNASVAVPIGSSVEVVNLSTDVNTTVSAAGGVTFNGGPVVLSPGSSVTLVKIGTNAWMAQGQGSPGLVHIASSSFSSASSVSVNDCFSTNYVNYRVQVNGTCSTNVGYNFRLRVSGTDATTNYKNRAIQNDGTITTVNTATTYIELGIASSSGFATQFLVSRPFITETTMVSGQNAANDWGTFISGHHNAATSYTGFTMYLSTGNISGNVKVYGLRD